MYNRVVLMGRITHDLEPKTMQSNGEMVLPFSIAVDRGIGKDGEKETDFFNCTAFRKTAEFINNYFGKGRMILVEGKLQNNNYTDKNGAAVKAIKIIVDNAQFTGEKKEENNTYQQTGYTAQPQQAAYQQPQQSYSQQPAMYQQPVQMPNQQTMYQQSMQQLYPQQQQSFAGQFAAPPVNPTVVQNAPDDYPF